MDSGNKDLKSGGNMSTNSDESSTEKVKYLY